MLLLRLLELDFQGLQVCGESINRTARCLKRDREIQTLRVMRCGRGPKVSTNVATTAIGIQRCQTLLLTRPSPSTLQTSQ